jgi:hypothetical protein
VFSRLRKKKRSTVTAKPPGPDGCQKLDKRLSHQLKPCKDRGRRRPTLTRQLRSHSYVLPARCPLVRSRCEPTLCSLKAWKNRILHRKIQLLHWKNLFHHRKCEFCVWKCDFCTRKRSLREWKNALCGRKTELYTRKYSVCRRAGVFPLRIANTTDLQPVRDFR